MNLFDKRKDILKNLLNVSNNQSLIDSIISLQNEIEVKSSAKVVAVASVSDDDLSAVFAKAFADVFSINGKQALVIDANLYNPCLESIVSSKKESENKKCAKIISLKKETYPGEEFKKDMLKSLISKNKLEYEHIVIIVPTLLNHTDILLLSELIDSVVLVCQRNVTVKRDIAYAIECLRENKMPLVKTVILK